MQGLSATGIYNDIRNGVQESVILLNEFSRYDVIILCLKTSHSGRSKSTTLLEIVKNMHAMNSIVTTVVSAVSMIQGLPAPETIGHETLIIILDKRYTYS